MNIVAGIAVMIGGLAIGLGFFVLSKWNRDQDERIEALEGHIARQEERLARFNDLDGQILQIIQRATE